MSAAQVPTIPFVHAARCLSRLWSRKALEHDRAAAADAGFDGGEWSGPWHAVEEQRHYERLVVAVAERFSISAEQLERAAQRLAHAPEQVRP